VSARILIIEDNPTNMELMVYLLRAFGYTPLTAADGEEGVAAAQRERPDLIICDVHLPKLDGYGVVAALKADPATRHIPALAVTALAMVGDRERLLGAGFDGYIGKPIEPDSFVTQLESFLPGEMSPRNNDDIATILIVDDHVLNRQFLMTLLGFSGHRLMEAASGIEALKLIEHDRPDLIISDILMPNMDGYEFVARVRENPETADVPIIFYTATYREREAVAVAQSCGVRWVLPKPSDPDVIMNTVQEALGTPARSAQVQDYAAELAAGGASAPPADTSLGGIGNKMAEYLDEVESSSQVISELAQHETPDGEAERLRSMTQRLSNSLSSLQAVSLRLTALIELGIDLSAEREPQALVDIGCRVAQNICVAKYACIGVLNEAGDGLGWFSHCGTAEQTRVLCSDPAAGVLKQVMAERQPVRRHCLPGDPCHLGLPAEHPPVHSFIGVPIASSTGVHGWLYLADKLGDDGFSEVDERIAVTVASQIAVSYENLKLYEEVRRSHAQLQQDMDARSRLTEDLRRFRLAMDATADAIFLVDRANMCFVDVNVTACRMLGFAREDFLQVGQRERSGGPMQLVDLYDKLLAGDQGGAMAELMLHRRDGSLLSVEVQRRTLRSDQNWILVAVARDITERKEAERRLLKLAHFDTLTGLPNRSQLYE